MEHPEEPRGERLKMPQIAPLVGLSGRRTYELFVEGHLPNRGTERDKWCTRPDVDAYLQRRVLAQHPPGALPAAPLPPLPPEVSPSERAERAERAGAPLLAEQLAVALLPEGTPEAHAHVVDVFHDIWRRLMLLSERQQGSVAVLKLEEFRCALKAAERRLARLARLDPSVAAGLALVAAGLTVAVAAAGRT